MSTFLDLVKKRYSVRCYQDTPVDEALLLKILETASLAPSACNNQPWVFIVIRKEEGRRNLAKVYERPWFLEAPVIVSLCCDLSKSWKRKDGKNFGDIDVAIAMDHITIAAAEAGLGTCWIGNFDIAEARRVLEVPQHIEPVVFTPLGYPAIEPVPKRRKSLDEIVCWEKFGGKYGD
jgi:nitroreductase